MKAPEVVLYLKELDDCLVKIAAAHVNNLEQDVCLNGLRRLGDAQREIKAALQSFELHGRGNA